MPSPESVRQETTWIVVPNGLTADGQQAVCSVFVSPRLEADDAGGPPRLANFPDWVDWPARLRQARFHFDLLAEEPVAATVLPLAASSKLWRQIFSATTLVEPFTGNDFSRHPVMTYSAPVAADSMRQSYAGMSMTAMDGMPSMATMQGMMADAQGIEASEGQQATPFDDVKQAMEGNYSFLRAGDDEVQRGMQFLFDHARDNMAASEPHEMVEMVPATGDTSDEIGRLLVFHQATATATRNGQGDPQQVERLSRFFDFHKILSALAEHPALLRRLGLVFDVSLPTSTIEGFESSSLRLVVGWDSIDVGPNVVPSQDRTLFTLYTYAADDPAPFLATAGTYPRGFANLRDERFTVEQLDVDAAVVKAASMVKHVLDAPDASTESEMPAEEVGPAGLRTSGLVLVDRNRAEETYRGMVDAADIDELFGSPEQPLHAEDLTRGYRLDIYDEEAGTWRSLHARTVQFLRDGKDVIEPVQDEGWFEPTVTSPPVAPGEEPDPDSPIYMNQALVHWDGWSLSTPRPGRSLSMYPGGTEPDRPETAPQRVVNEPLTSTGLQIEVRVTPGTLPKLRFGRTYRARLRTVNLAGNGLDLATANDLCARAEQEAESTGDDLVRWDTKPVHFLRHEPVPPPVLHRLPSDLPGQAAHRLVIRSGLDPDILVGPTPDQDESRLFAPNASVELVERHGMLDDAIGAPDGAAQRRIYQLASRESERLPTDRVVDEIPYLPDPLATGLAIVGLPGMPATETFKVKWQGETWDKPKPIRFHLVPHGELFTPAPTWDEAAGVITVPLTAARQVTIRVASLLPKDPPMGLLEWCENNLLEDQFRQLKAVVGNSRHCMFTPWQEVELVHAVQRPLTEPDLDAEQAGVKRAPGDTDFRLPGGTIPDPYSTASLDLIARWQDWVDDPAVEMRSTKKDELPTWAREAVVEVGSIPVLPLVEGETVAPRVPFYSDSDAESPDEPGDTLEVGELGALPYQVPEMPPLQFADTKHRKVTFTARAVTRFAEFFPPDLAGQPGRLSVEGSSVELSLPSTARPPVPEVLDVVPTMGITVDDADPTLRRREGGWLRIYLARPWYVTGEGEQLGVVVPTQTPPGPQDPHYEMSSLFGGDLAHYSSAPQGLAAGPVDDSPYSVAIDNAGGQLTGVQIPELLERMGELPLPFTIERFDPLFDEPGQRWYVDVHLQHGRHFPMTRLAVTRVQPNSIEGEGDLSQHHYTISPVVPLEPVPLLPDRELRVDRSDPAQFKLTLQGPSYWRILDLDGSENDSIGIASLVTARLQKRRGRSITPDRDEDWVTEESWPFTTLTDELGQLYWEIALELDTDAPVEPGNWRLLVVEEDRLPTDPVVSTPSVPAVGHEMPYSRRLVYADAIPLDHEMTGASGP